MAQTGFLIKKMDNSLHKAFTGDHTCILSQHNSHKHDLTSLNTNEKEKFVKGLSLIYNSINSFFAFRVYVQREEVLRNTQAWETRT